MVAQRIRSTGQFKERDRLVTDLKTNPLFFQPHKQLKMNTFYVSLFSECGNYVIFLKNYVTYFSV